MRFGIKREIGNRTSGAIATTIRAENLLQMRFEVVKKLQHRVVRVPAGMSGGVEIEVNAAGKRPDAIDATALASEVEEGAISGLVRPFREQIQYLLLGGKEIGPALAAGTGRAAAGEFHFPATKRMGKDPAAEAVRRPVKEGDLTPPVATGPFGPDNPPFQLFDFPCKDCGRVTTLARLGHLAKHRLTPLPDGDGGWVSTQRNSCYYKQLVRTESMGGCMRHLFLHVLFMSLICLFVTGCIVQVRPIPVLEVHPLSVELHD